MPEQGARMLRLIKKNLESRIRGRGNPKREGAEALGPTAREPQWPICPKGQKPKGQSASRAHLRPKGPLGPKNPWGPRNRSPHRAHPYVGKRKTMVGCIGEPDGHACQGFCQVGQGGAILVGPRAWQVAKKNRMRGLYRLFFWS